MSKLTDEEQKEYDKVKKKAFNWLEEIIKRTSIKLTEDFQNKKLHREFLKYHD